MWLAAWWRKSLSPPVKQGIRDIAVLGFSCPMEDEDLSPDEWLQRGRVDPRTITAYYAGILAMAYYCALYGGEDDYLEGSE